MRSLTVFGSGDFRSQKSKLTCFICCISYKIWSGMIPVTAADFESFSSYSKAALYTVNTLHRIVQPKLKGTGFDPR